MTGPPAVEATIVVPTTGDRGPVLRHSIGSVLAQTVTDLEVFVIGDGIDPATRDAVLSLAEADPRVRLFEFPKHERRGEPNRHEVLTSHARGRIVAYLCDRDLWFPDHVAELGLVLADADFGHTLRFQVVEDETFAFTTHADLRTPAGRPPTRRGPGLVPLSMAAHTLDAYRRLPFGWRTTPPTTATDRHMWEQFLAEPWVRVAASPLPTVLTFKRGDHPGWSTAERLAILERWAPRVADRAAADALRREVLDALWADWARLVDEAGRRAARSPRARLAEADRRARRLGRRVRSRWRLVAGGVSRAGR